MTQLADIHARIAEPTNTKGIVSPLPTSTATAETSNKIETFVITFVIAFAILYTVFERWNWPLFTYHPAVGKIDFWMHAARSGEGPPMYWYGWLALAFPCAAVVGWGATLVDWRLVQRLTLFFCGSSWNRVGGVCGWRPDKASHFVGIMDSGRMGNLASMLDDRKI
jgi:hypothetical protein